MYKNNTENIKIKKTTNALPNKFFCQINGIKTEAIISKEPRLVLFDEKNNNMKIKKPKYLLNELFDKIKTKELTETRALKNGKKRGLFSILVLTLISNKLGKNEKS